MDDSTVRHVLLYTALKPGNVMLCECEDGLLRLFMDDQPLDAERWRTTEVDAATAAYHELRRALTAAGRG
jgi:hypothetical protein